MRHLVVKLFATFLFLALATGLAPARSDDSRIESIAEDAYVFGFPIVMSYRTWFFFLSTKRIHSSLHR